MKIELKLDTCYINKGLELQYHTLTYVETLLYGQTFLVEEIDGNADTKRILPSLPEIYCADGWKKMPRENFGVSFDKLDEEGGML